MIASFHLFNLVASFHRTLKRTGHTIDGTVDTDLAMENNDIVKKIWTMTTDTGGARKRVAKGLGII
jgi:hypothetical protein